MTPELKAALDDVTHELVEVRGYLESIADSLERLVDLRQMAEREDNEEERYG